MTIPKGISDLFEEKSLLSVYLHSSFLSESTLDSCIKFVSAFLLMCFCLYLNISDRQQLYILFEALSKWAEIGFNYSVQILGFLLAGFTIFATTTDTKVFVGLSKVTQKGRSITQLKFLFFSFLRVFIVHLTVLIGSVLISMGKAVNKPVLELFKLNDTQAYDLRATIVSFLFVFLGSFIVSALLQLKTFVWNLYQSVIFSVANSVERTSPSQPETPDT